MKNSFAVNFGNDSLQTYKFSCVFANTAYLIPLLMLWQVLVLNLLKFIPNGLLVHRASPRGASFVNFGIEPPKVCKLCQLRQELNDM